MIDRIVAEYGFLSRHELYMVTAKAAVAGIGFLALVVIAMAVL